MSFAYSVFGLEIISEIECPQLQPGNGPPFDAIVRVGAVPDGLVEVLSRGETYQINSDCLLLSIPGTARFLISQGTEILVDPHPGAADRDIGLFLLGSSFGALLLQRGYWPLHGSAVAAGLGAVIFTGAAGIGKSTLAGEFDRRGFPVLADDISAITVGPDGIARLWPAYPGLKLRPDAVVRLGKDPGSLSQAHKAVEKYEFPLKAYHPAPLPVHAIYNLAIHERPGILLSTLKGFAKLNTLTMNTYRLHFLVGMQKEQWHFQQARVLARQARVMLVSRPHQPNTLKVLADQIERDLSQ